MYNQTRPGGHKTINRKSNNASHVKRSLLYATKDMLFDCLYQTAGKCSAVGEF